MKKGLVLRDYQKKAIDRILWAQSLEGNDLCVLPTGSGKSVVIAHLAHTLNESILILQPTKEILKQNYQKLLKYVSKKDVGIYSASMNEKTIKKYTFATIQSIYKKPEEFKHFKQVIVDECHLVNPKNLEGMFTSFLKAINSPKVIGFTASPYRLGVSYYTKNGSLNANTATKLINRMKEHFWNRIIFNINNEELLKENYLVPLTYVDMAIIDQNQIPVNKSLSDFDLVAYEKEISKKQKEIIEAISYGENNAKSVLVFCSSINQAETLAKLFKNAQVVTSKTADKERDEIVEGFKSGIIKTVFNVGVLTMGFDHPALDCIILLRPTRSIGLYYQMLGRGVRMAPNKTTCKVIDLTSTVKYLGKIESIKLTKLETGWELLSETGSWHNKPLYSYSIKSLENATLHHSISKLPPAPDWIKKKTQQKLF